MRTIGSITLLALLLIFSTGQVTKAATAEEMVTEYIMDVADFNRVDYDAVNELSKLGIRNDELPVVYRVAQLAKVSPEKVAQVRLDGKSWAGICAKFNVKMSQFYVVISGKVESQQYAPILNAFKNTPKRKWDKMNLTDRDIVSLVNLRFIYKHHDYSPYVVMRMKDYDRTFSHINYRVRVARDEKIKRDLAQLSKKTEGARY